MINSAKFTTASCLIGNHLLRDALASFSTFFLTFLNGLAPVTEHLLATRDLSHSHEFRQLDLRTINPRS